MFSRRHAAYSRARDNLAYRGVSPWAEDASGLPQYLDMHGGTAKLASRMNVSILSPKIISNGKSLKKLSLARYAVCRFSRGVL